jgi:hypothetical protein
VFLKRLGYRSSGETKMSVKQSFASSLIVGMMVAGCIASPPNQQTAISERQATKIAEKVIASFATKDPKTLTDFYTPDRVFLDSEHNEPFRDDARLMAFASGLMSLEPTQTILSRTIKVLDHDTFVNTALGSVRIKTDTGPTIIKVRYTQVFQKQKDGTWKIAVEHLSNAPEG